MLTIIIVLVFAALAAYTLINQHPKKTVIDPKPIDIAEPIKEQPINGVILTPEDEISDAVSEDTVAEEAIGPILPVKPKRKRAKSA